MMKFSRQTALRYWLAQDTDDFLSKKQVSTLKKYYEHFCNFAFEKIVGNGFYSEADLVNGKVIYKRISKEQAAENAVMELELSNVCDNDGSTSCYEFFVNSLFAKYVEALKPLHKNHTIEWDERTKILTIIA